jgi:pyrroline-5-carboxylate reductase
MDSSALPRSLLLIGAGKMGGAMLEGWLKLGLAPEQVTIIDPGLPQERREALAKRGIGFAGKSVSARHAEVVVLAIKPQMLDQAALDLNMLINEQTLLISVMAGKTIADIRARLPRLGAIIRAMPNTPAAVGRGISALVAEACADTPQRSMAERLLRGIGQVEWLDEERLIDAVTAVSGSGPAYVFHMVEALAAAGAAAGLPGDLALRLARATVEGAGELLYRQPETSAARLRENVTSPGGTTAAALGVLMAPEGLTDLMSRTVAAAKQRAEELAG